MEKIKVLELFGGIGACTQALKRLNIDIEIVDYVEIDKYAVASYNAMNGTNFKPQNIINWDKNIEADLIMHGSPCQDFSIAGQQAGGDEGSGTRSSLMYETLRIVDNIKPRYVIWENVKNILSPKHKHNYDNYCNEMNRLGYINYSQVLNSKNYGIPQNRERVFTISIRKDLKQRFYFPQKQELKLKLKNLIEDEVDEKYYLSDQAISGRLTTNYQKYKLEENVVNDREIHPTILARFDGAPTLYINNNLRIRKLTPKECWRLMGFSDEAFEKAKKVNNDTQLYKQAGNSIVVNVLVEILRNLL